MTSKAASRIVIERGSRHRRATRFAAALAARSSALRWRVHSFVTERTFNDIAVEGSKGLAIAPSLHDDCRLAPVGVLDSRAGEMYDEDDGLSGLRSGFGKNGFEPLTMSAERTEWICETDAPVGAGNDAAPLLVRTKTEGRLDHAPQSLLIDAGGAFVPKAVRVCAGGCEQGAQMLAADHPQGLGFYGLAVALQSGEQLLNLGALWCPVAVEQ